MKILVTTEFYLPFRCGVTVAVLNLKKALEMKGHEVRVLTIGSNRKKSYYADGVYYIKSNLPQFYKDSYATLSFGGEIFEDIIEWHPDIVHSQCEFFTMVYAKKVARKLDIPIVHTCHTDFDSYMHNFTSNEKLWNHMTNRYIPKLLKKCSQLICPTTKMKDVLTGYGINTPINVIPSGLDLARYQQALEKDKVLRLRSRYGFKEDDFVLISVCRLSEEKRVDESISLFSSLVRSFPEAKLLIVGDGTMKEVLERQVTHYGLADSVKFTGSVPMEEVWKYYKAADCFISSSDSETQGLTYFEALASGIPVICRPDRAIRDTIVNGYNGFLFDSENEFLKEMESVFSGKYHLEDLKNNSAESVAEYSLEIFADKIIAVYTESLLT